MIWGAGTGVGEQDMGLRGGKTDLLHRRPSDSAGTGDGNEPLGLRQVPRAPVSEGQLLLGDRPVLGLTEILELAGRLVHHPRGVPVLAVLAQRGPDPQPGAGAVPAAEPLV